MFSLSLAQLRTHLARLVATTLAIVIAVGFVVATLVLNETTKTTVFNAVAGQYKDTDAVVTVDDLPPTTSRCPSGRAWRRRSAASPAWPP